jgi:hypothetical protein
MKRNVVITALLIIAGIILAFVLFGAGAIWKGRSSPRRSSQVVPAPVMRWCLIGGQAQSYSGGISARTTQARFCWQGFTNNAPDPT